MESRRLLYRVILKALFLIGLIALVWVFISSLFINAQSTDKEAAQALMVELSLKGMKRGDIRKARLGNKEVAVLYRMTPIFFESKKSDTENQSSLNTDYFVYFNQGDSGNCPLFHSNKSFKDICSGGVFDETGKSKTNPEHGFQLKVPPHFFDGENLHIGKWSN